MQDRIPPHSEEAERGALGAMLQEALRLLPVAGRLGVTPESFYVPAHRLVCEAIFGVVNEKRVADALTVEEWLRRTGDMDRIGGVRLLYRLIDETPAAAHGEYYLDIVRQKQVLRDVVQICGEAQRKCYEAERGDQLAGQTADRLAGVMEREGPREETNKEALAAVLAQYRAANAGEQTAMGLPVPWEDLHELLCGLEPGVTIVAGRASMGKTTLEDCVWMGLASQGEPVGRVTADSSRRSLLARAACRRAGVSMPKLKSGHARKSQLQQFAEAKEVIQDYPIFINAADRDIGVICPWTRMMVKKYGIKLLTLDHVGLLTAAIMGNRQWDKVALVTYVSGELKRLAFELSLPVLLLVQLSRAPAKDGKLRAPVLSDLRDSGALEQDAEKVVMVYRDEKKAREMEKERPGATKGLRPTWVDVQKHKDGETGRIPFWFRCSYFRFDQTTSEFPEGCLDDEEDEGVIAEFDDSAYEQPAVQGEDWEPEDEQGEFAPVDGREEPPEGMEFHTT